MSSLLTLVSSSGLLDLALKSAAVMLLAWSLPRCWAGPRLPGGIWCGA